MPGRSDARRSPGGGDRPRGRIAHALGCVTGWGWALAVVGTVLGATGWWLGWVELAVPGLAALAALAVATLFLVGRSAYRVELDLADHRVVVGTRAVGRIVVANASARRLLPAYIELPVGAGSADFSLPALGAGAEHEEVFAVPTHRRAVVQVGPVRSVRGDALGLARRAVRWTDPHELFVHPATVALRGTSTGVLRDLEGQATRVVSDSDLSFHALRDYVPGDDKRHIHWRSTARAGTLMVRQFEDTRRTHTAIALATDLDQYGSADEAELAVSAVASIGVQALRDEREVTVLAGEGKLRVATPPVLLDDCAAIELAAARRGGLELASWVARQVPDASVAVLVTGQRTDATALRATTAHIPSGVRVVLVRCVLGAPLAVGQTGSVTTTTLGDLPDLGRLLRRAVTP